MGDRLKQLYILKNKFITTTASNMAFSNLRFTEMLGFSNIGYAMTSLGERDDRDR